VKNFVKKITGPQSVKNEKHSKLDPLWFGPYKILEIDNKGPNAVIETSKKKKQKVHVNRLKAYLSAVSGDRT
jgi:hypothetical protein